ncbi:hypothetical protein ACA085_18015, partial [Xanthomonas fragariae]
MPPRLLRKAALPEVVEGRRQHSAAVAYAVMVLQCAARLACNASLITNSDQLMHLELLVANYLFTHLRRAAGTTCSSI